MEEIYCFAGNPLDRASERRRDTAWIRALLDDPAARILPLTDLRPLTRGAAAPVLDWQKVAPWRDRIEHQETLGINVPAEMCCPISALVVGHGWHVLTGADIALWIVPDLDDPIANLEGEVVHVWSGIEGDRIP